MAGLGVRRSWVKEIGALVAEYARRLKPDGRPFRRSPLTRLIELEVLCLGVQGKGCLWRTLEELPHAIQGCSLDMTSLSTLQARAEDQRLKLEGLRLEAARTALSKAVNEA
jgi:hypothetical protein